MMLLLGPRGSFGQLDALIIVARRQGSSSCAEERARDYKRQSRHRGYQGFSQFLYLCVLEHYIIRRLYHGVINGLFFAINVLVRTSKFWSNFIYRKRGMSVSVLGCAFSFDQRRNASPFDKDLYMVGSHIDSITYGWSDLGIRFYRRFCVLSSLSRFETRNGSWHVDQQVDDSSRVTNYESLRRLIIGKPEIYGGSRSSKISGTLSPRRVEDVETRNSLKSSFFSSFFFSAFLKAKSYTSRFGRSLFF